MPRSAFSEEVNRVECASRRAKGFELCLVAVATGGRPDVKLLSDSPAQLHPRDATKNNINININNKQINKQTIARKVAGEDEIMDNVSNIWTVLCKKV